MSVPTSQHRNWSSERLNNLPKNTAGRKSDSQVRLFFGSPGVREELLPAIEFLFPQRKSQPSSLYTCLMTPNLDIYTSKCIEEKEDKNTSRRSGTQRLKHSSIMKATGCVGKDTRPGSLQACVKPQPRCSCAFWPSAVIFSLAASGIPTLENYPDILRSSEYLLSKLVGDIKGYIRYRGDKLKLK